VSGAARRAGDRGWLLELPDGVVPAHAAGALRRFFAGQIEDVVPGDCTVLVVGDVPVDDLLRVAANAEAEQGPEPPLVEVPVVYDGPDLDEVAGLTGLTVDEVVTIHSGGTYTAAFLGFVPGWAYLVGLDERLRVPRREHPRERVPAGTVAIAGPYTGVYPRETPGGWRLLGSTDVALFDAGREPPTYISAGDLVRFVPR
jgi:KipI family sensor histidine kinase inhibitor